MNNYQPVRNNSFEKKVAATTTLLSAVSWLYASAEVTVAANKGSGSGAALLWLKCETHRNRNIHIQAHHHCQVRSNAVQIKISFESSAFVCFLSGCDRCNDRLCI